MNENKEAKQLKDWDWAVPIVILIVIYGVILLLLPTVGTSGHYYMGK